MARENPVSSARPSRGLLFSALCAFGAIQFNMPYLGPWITIGGYFGLLFLTSALRNSAWGLLSVFALTGFMGLTLGPIVGMVTQAYSNGSEIVMLALAGTGIAFLGLSGFALTTKRDFSGMGKFLFVGILVAFLAGIANIFFGIPALSLAISSFDQWSGSAERLWLSGRQHHYEKFSLPLPPRCRTGSGPRTAGCHAADSWRPTGARAHRLAQEPWWITWYERQSGPDTIATLGPDVHRRHRSQAATLAWP